MYQLSIKWDNWCSTHFKKRYTLVFWSTKRLLSLFLSCVGQDGMWRKIGRRVPNTRKHMSKRRREHEIWEVDNLVDWGGWSTLFGVDLLDVDLVSPLTELRQIKWPNIDPTPPLQTLQPPHLTWPKKKPTTSHANKINNHILVWNLK